MRLADVLMGPELSLNNLFRGIGSNFDFTLVFCFAGPGDAQHMSAWRNGIQNDAARAPNTPMSFIIHIHFRTLRRHHDYTGLTFRSRLGVSGCRMHLVYPFHRRRRTRCRVALKCMHHCAFQFR
jgi:hypothetical protein